MSGVELYTRQVLDRPLDEVFEFFSDAHNLGAITPAWLRFRILTPAIEMRVGTTIDYRLHLGPVPLKWRSEITVWEPPSRFVDEQRRGPYRFWVHEHRFTAQGSRTVVEDVVHYAPPGGRLVDALFVRPQIRLIFGHRQRVLAERFGSIDDGVLRFRRLVPASEARAGADLLGRGEKDS